MFRGNKLWEGHRMIIPEHRSYMLAREDRQALQERPVLDESALEEMNRALAEAVAAGRLVTLTVFRPTGDEAVSMVPRRLDGERLMGLSVAGEKIGVPFYDIIGVE